MLLDQQRQIDELRQALLDRNKAAQLPRCEPAPNLAGRSLRRWCSCEQRRSGQHHPDRSATPVPHRPRRYSPVNSSSSAIRPRPRRRAAVDFRIVAAAIQNRRRLYHAGRVHGYDFRVPVDQSGIGHRHELRQHPLRNTPAGSLTETRLSPQNCRIGMRIDALVQGLEGAGLLGV